ncbi:hypothetical protein niasHS_008861 [Heterodera schachtii]|uniref:Uncharacterized protein n=1 Tax=Heterodera schachtii TaxID=97005 RepID=A0ABD2IVN8_HETSC
MSSFNSPICLISVLIMLLIDPCFNNNTNINLFNPASDDCVVAVRNRTMFPYALYEYVYGTLRTPELRDAARKADVFRNTFTTDCVPYGEFGELWGGFWGCLTFTCKDEHGKDIFRMNGCNPESGKKCPKFFNTFCWEAGGTSSSCRHCDELVDGKVCNSFDQLINLDQPADDLNSNSNSYSSSKAEKLGPAP